MVQSPPDRVQIGLVHLRTRQVFGLNHGHQGQAGVEQEAVPGEDPPQAIILTVTPAG